MSFSKYGGRTYGSDGFTLIELMVAMVLGLVVIGGATTAILANRQSYRTNEALSQVQESARTAFELLARDIREAGVTGCDSSGQMANVLRTSATPRWWQNWFGITGYEGTTPDGVSGFGTAAADRISGTDSLLLQGVQGSGLSVQSHSASDGTFTLTTTTSDVAAGDIMLVCDFNHSAIFQAGSYNNSTRVLGFTTATTPAPGNCSLGLGYPTDCASSGNFYTYDPNSQIVHLAAVHWYIGSNTRTDEGGRSLYRHRLASAGSAATAEEIVAGVTDMQITYRMTDGTAFVAANHSSMNWANVNAVMITLTLDSADRRVTTDTAVNSGRLRRTFTNIVTLRNRVS